MAGKFFVGFPIGKELFFTRLPQDTDHSRRQASLRKPPLYPEPRRPPGHILLIGAPKITFCETQVIQGSQQVGLADPIVSANADDPFLKREGGLGIVLKLKERYI